MFLIERWAEGQIMMDCVVLLKGYMGSRAPMLRIIYFSFKKVICDPGGVAGQGAPGW